LSLLANFWLVSAVYFFHAVVLLPQFRGHLLPCKQRENHHMGVLKRTWKTSKGEDREAWILVYRQRQPDGTLKRFTETYERKKDADARAAQVKVDIGKGTHVPPSTSITIAEAAELWLQTCASKDLERATLQGYRSEVAHLLPLVGHQRLATFTKGAARALEDKLRITNSPVMTRRLLSTLSAIFNDAIEREKVALNPVAGLSRKRRVSGVKQSSRDKGKLEIGVNIPKLEEVKAIIEHATNQRWRVLLTVAAFTGLRASELRGLRWANVDFTKNQIHVRERADKYSKIGKCKSKSGYRDIPLPNAVALVLKEWRLQTPGELVFPANKSGGIIALWVMVECGLIPAVRKAGLVVKWKPDKEGEKPPRAMDRNGMMPKYTGLHSFRHFFASLCINSERDGGLGLSPKAAQELLGHAKISITYDIYGHLFPRGDDGGALDRVAGALLG
jgi:integrase